MFVNSYILFITTCFIYNYKIYCTKDRPFFLNDGSYQRPIDVLFFLKPISIFAKKISPTFGQLPDVRFSTDTDILKFAYRCICRYFNVFC